MPKKTTILIVILLIFTVGLIYIAVKTEQQSPPAITQEQITQEEALDLVPTINPQTQISFSPAIIDTIESPQSTYSAQVVVNTHGQKISGIQLDLAYDPAILRNVRVTPSQNNLFGPNPAVLINSIDPDLGRITLAISLPDLNDEEISGNASIANITFSTNTSSTPTAQISVLPKTTVRSIRSTNSLLLDAQPLNIKFSAPTAVPTTSTQTTPTPVVQ